MEIKITYEYSPNKVYLLYKEINNLVILSGLSKKELNCLLSFIQE